MNKNTAIQEDVVEEVGQETKEQPELERDVMADKIAAKIKASRSDEIQSGDNKADEDPEDILELKVDGVVVQKTRREVDDAGGIVEMQKSLTADKRLEENAAEKKRLAAIRQEQEAYSQKLKELEDKLSAKLNAKPIEFDQEAYEAALQEKATAIYSGDEDALIEAEKKLDRIRIISQQQNIPQLNMEDVETVIADRFKKAETKSSIERGIQRANAEYSEIMNDRFLKSQANERTIILSEEHPDWSEEEIIIEAMKQTQEWRGITQKTLIEEKEDRKKNLQRIPTASTRNEVDMGYQPKTKAEIFADIKAGRARK